jgi:hypothetical protein
MGCVNIAGTAGGDVALVPVVKIRCVNSAHNPDKDPIDSANSGDQMSK